MLCHAQSHIANDECGAPEFYTGGARLTLLGGADAKIDPAQLAVEARRKAGDVHSMQPSCVSVTQATETGGVYTLDELRAIGAVCRDAGLPLHMDGARFANALVSLDCSPAEMTWKAGVTALSFGAQERRAGRGGHRAVRSRAGQGGCSAASAAAICFPRCACCRRRCRPIWTAICGCATRARPMPWRGAWRPAWKACPAALQGRADANILFCRLPAAAIDSLLAQGFGFYHDRWGPGIVRLVTSFATREQDVDHFLSALRAAVARA